MSKEATPAKKDLGFLAMSDLVGEAMTEYYEKHDQIVSELQTRAEALVNRIMPDHKSYVECYHGGGESVFCDVEDLTDGFGLLSLSFHKGTTPEADYFLIENYLELTSSIRIYTLYDLGRALCDITEMAQEVLKAYKRVVLDSAQGSDTQHRMSATQE
jgi:hypothetical protein